jgi:hypothetical protein
LGAALSVNVAASGSLTVYFIPFGVQTYLPVTTETIVASSWERWTVSDDAPIYALVELFEPDLYGPEFDFKNVRALVCHGDSKYYIDSMGKVMVNGLRMRIDRDDFIKLMRRHGALANLRLMSS